MWGREGNLQMAKEQNLRTVKQIDHRADGDVLLFSVYINTVKKRQANEMSLETVTTTFYAVGGPTATHTWETIDLRYQHKVF